MIEDCNPCKMQSLWDESLNKLINTVYNLFGDKRKNNLLVGVQGISDIRGIPLI